MHTRTEREREKHVPTQEMGREHGETGRGVHDSGADAAWRRAAMTVDEGCVCVTQPYTQRDVAAWR